MIRSLASFASAALGAVCLTLASVIFYEATAPLPLYKLPLARSPALPKIQQIETFVPAPASRFSEVEAKMLFNPARGPFKEAEAPPPKRVLPRPQLALIGVLLDSKVQIAVVRLQGNQDAIDLRVGQDIAGWKVEGIRPDRLDLKADDQSLSVALQRGGAGQPSRAQRAPRARAEAAVSPSPYQQLSGGQ